MTKKAETIIQDSIIQYLKNNKILHWRISGASNLSGFPDILVCHNGRFIALEIKTPFGKPTLQQEKVIRDIVNAGGIARLVISVEDVEKVIKEAHG